MGSDSSRVSAEILPHWDWSPHIQPSLQAAHFRGKIQTRPDQIADCRPVQTCSFIRQKGKSISRGSYRIRNALQSFASVGHCYQLENSIPSIFGLTHILTILNSIIRYRINQITVSKAHKMLLFDELCSLLHNPHMGEQLSGAWQTFKLKTLKTSRFREREHPLRADAVVERMRTFCPTRSKLKPKTI